MFNFLRKKKYVYFVSYLAQTHIYWNLEMCCDFPVVDMDDIRMIEKEIERLATNLDSKPIVTNYILMRTE